MDKLPLLFLCHRIPYPPNKGDKIRSFHLLRHLARHFDIYMATFVDDDQDWQWVPELEKYCKETIFVDLNKQAARFRSLSGLISGEVLSLPYYRNTKMQKWIRSRVAEHRIEHLLVFSAAMAQYVLDPEMGFHRRVIDFVDIDSDKWQQYAMQKKWPMNWLYRREGRLLLDFEREVAKQFDAALFVSSTEADMFKKLAPDSSDKIGFYNNGVNTDYFCRDEKQFNPYGAGERVIVFTGAMDYWPNIDAVVWFTREVLPRLRAMDSALQFYIVGSSPSGAVKQLASFAGVTVTGRVEDVRPYIQHAVAAVAPMRIARGVQNKVLEAMAMEKPVIVTSKGLEGIDARHGDHVMLADSADEFVQCLKHVSEEDFAGIGENARLLISRDFNWEQNLPEVVLLLAGGLSPVQLEVASA